MRTPFRYGNRLFSLAGQLLIFPALKDFIADVFGYGWDRNRAIDSKGAHGNALMGGYLLAASNTVIAITGILTTDTIKALTKDGLVGSIAVNGTISFSTGLKYGAFEVYRGTTRIGRYCLTERQDLQIINQVTGGLPNGLLGGTTTTVWQRSNAFYSETNNTGYSISGTGWVTSAGASLTAGTIIPADPLNQTKCMAWVSGVQQDLQFIGKARNSVSVVPTAFYCNNDRHWVGVPNAATVTSYYVSAYIIPETQISAYGPIYAASINDGGTIGTDRGLSISQDRNVVRITMPGYRVGVSITKFLNAPVLAEGIFENSELTIRATNLNTWEVLSYSIATAASIVMGSSTAWIARRSVGGSVYYYTGYIGRITEIVNGVTIFDAVPDQYSTNYIDVKNKINRSLVGISTNLLQNVDLVYNLYNSVGYELWYNGTDYKIYPLASDGTRIITPAGYEWQETVTAGNMPSVVDSRMSTFKYALANSYAVRQSVPEAFDTTDPCAPKLLTYPELSVLSANPKVIKTEADGKITNIKIK